MKKIVTTSWIWVSARPIQQTNRTASGFSISSTWKTPWRVVRSSYGNVGFNWKGAHFLQTPLHPCSAPYFGVGWHGRRPSVADIKQVNLAWVADKSHLRWRTRQRKWQGYSSMYVEIKKNENMATTGRIRGFNRCIFNFGKVGKASALVWYAEKDSSTVECRRWAQNEILTFFVGLQCQRRSKGYGKLW